MKIKKIFKIILVLLGVVAFLYMILSTFLIVWFFQNAEKTEYSPPKPDSLPAKAFWAGDKNGGLWFIFSNPDEKKNTVKASIYTHTGKIHILTKTFSPKQSFQLTKDFSFENSVQNYDGHIIQLNNNRKLYPVND